MVSAGRVGVTAAGPAPSPRAMASRRAAAGCGARAAYQRAVAAKVGSAA
ncbi:MAG: hypothetical protein R3F65_08500 [bacterium]